MKDEGKAPKTSQAIRSRLGNISESANVKREQGPYVDSNGTDRQVVVASFFNRRLGQQFQSVLSRNGIFSESVSNNQQLTITVDYEDVQAATLLTQKFLSENPDARPKHMGARFDWLIFGGMLGFVVGLIFGVASQDAVASAQFIVALTTGCAAAGYLLDSLVRFNRNQTIIFGLWVLMLLVFSVAMAVVAIQALPALLR